MERQACLLVWFAEALQFCRYVHKGLKSQHRAVKWSKIPYLAMLKNPLKNSWIRIQRQMTSDLRESFIADVSLDKGIPIKFWK